MTELRAAPPREVFQTRECWTLDSVDGLAGLRGSLFEALTGTPYVSGASSLDEVPEKMVLVASELATNALRHGTPPTIVTYASDGEEHLLDVADHDPASAPEVVSDRGPGEGGFGLVLAEKLSLEVGWYVTDTTKHIWATFPADPAE